MNSIIFYLAVGLSLGSVVLCFLILGILKDSSRHMMQIVEVITGLHDSVQSGGGGQVEGGAGADAAVGESLKKYDKHFSVIASTLSSFSESSDKGFKRVDQDLVRIESLVTGMRDYLQESNQHLTRLQEGYDYSVLKRIVKPVINVANGLETLEPRLNESKRKEEADEVRALWLDLLDSLEQNGIERLQVEENDEFADIRKMAEATTTKELTDDSKKVGRVAEVVRPGYCYVYNYDKRRLVVPAQVKLYDKVEG